MHRSRSHKGAGQQTRKCKGMGCPCKDCIVFVAAISTMADAAAEFQKQLQRSTVNKATKKKKSKDKRAARWWKDLQAGIKRRREGAKGKGGVKIRSTKHLRLLGRCVFSACHPRGVAVLFGGGRLGPARGVGTRLNTMVGCGSWTSPLPFVD